MGDNKNMAPSQSIAIFHQDQKILEKIIESVQPLHLEKYSTNNLDDLRVYLNSKPATILCIAFKINKEEELNFLTSIKKKFPYTVRIYVLDTELETSELNEQLQLINAFEPFKIIYPHKDAYEYVVDFSGCLDKFFAEEYQRRLYQKQIENVPETREEVLFLKKKIKDLENEIVLLDVISDLNLKLEKRLKDKTKEMSILQQQLETSFLGMVKILAMQGKDNESQLARHSKKVAKYVTFLGRKHQFKDSQIFQLQLAAYLHDISKIKYINDILPSDLILAEESYLLVKQIPYLNEAAYIIRYHQLPHTSFHDYLPPDPIAQKMIQELGSDHIPLAAKFLGIANYYDQYLRDGVEGRTALKTIEHMKKKSIEFDVKLVHELEEYLRELGELDSQHFERPISLDQAKDGMILSRDLKNKAGKLLLSKEFKLTDEIIDGLKKRNLFDPITAHFYVYKTINDKL